MRNIAPNTAGYALRDLCTAIRRLLCRACAAIKPGIAVQENPVFTGICAACTAMCRALPHTRTHAGARVRTQERSSAQWEVSRYIAVQNPLGPPPSPSARLAHLAPRSPRFKDLCRSRASVRPVGGAKRGQVSIGTPACLLSRWGVANSHEGSFSFRQAPLRAQEISHGR
jgi:hypothetical protein